MNSSSLQMLVSMILYIMVVIGIGVYFAKRANENSENYYLGGRSLGPWVTAFSAEASDMSGWLLMGLPGLAYWCGIADAFWTALGLAAGTYVNWLVTAKRLRQYSIKVDNAITIPDFLSNRFHEKRKVILTLSSLFILVFFCVYAASCFVTCGKLFSSIFSAPYVPMMLCGVLLVVFYTFLGGFLAESTSDFMQAVIMIFALVCVLVSGTVAAGGLGEVLANLRSIPGFLDFFTLANPVTDANGVQQVVQGVPVFGESQNYGIIRILSMLAWGLGYFGVPQVLLRFMAIRDVDELTKSRRVATVWVVVSLASALFIGLVGRAFQPSALLTSSDAENIFSLLASILMHPLFAGIVMAGILAATISSSDSYLLIASSAFAKNLYQGVVKKDASDRQVMRMSRITLLAIAVLGAVIALDEDSIIFNIVSFAWAGFGATFGPVVILSLFWRGTSRRGAIAGMLSGAAMVFIWKFLISPLGGVFGIYELLPAFLVSLLFIIVFSRLEGGPGEDIGKEFDEVAAEVLG